MPHPDKPGRGALLSAPERLPPAPWRMAANCGEYKQLSSGTTSPSGAHGARGYGCQANLAPVRQGLGGAGSPVSRASCAATFGSNVAR